MQACGAQRAGSFRSAGHDPRRGQRLDQLGGQPPPFRRGDPAAEADAGVRYQNVGRLGDQRLGVALQLVVLGQRDHVDGRRAADFGAVAAQQCAQLLGAARCRHGYPVAGQRRRVWLAHINCVCPFHFRCVTEQLLPHCP